MKIWHGRFLPPLWFLELSVERKKNCKKFLWIHCSLNQNLGCQFGPKAPKFKFPRPYCISLGNKQSFKSKINYLGGVEVWWTVSWTYLITISPKFHFKADRKICNSVCVSHSRIFFYTVFWGLGLWCLTPLSTIFQLNRGYCSLILNNLGTQNNKNID